MIVSPRSEPLPFSFVTPSKEHESHTYSPYRALVVLFREVTLMFTTTFGNTFSVAVNVGMNVGRVPTLGSSVGYTLGVAVEGFTVGAVVGGSEGCSVIVRLVGCAVVMTVGTLVGGLVVIVGRLLGVDEGNISTGFRVG